MGCANDRGVGAKRETAKTWIRPILTRETMQGWLDAARPRADILLIAGRRREGVV